MTVVEDTCPCGATFRVDERNSVYAAMKHAGWLNAHAGCRALAAASDGRSDERN